MSRNRGTRGRFWWRRDCWHRRDPLTLLLSLFLGLPLHSIHRCHLHRQLLHLYLLHLLHLLHLLLIHSHLLFLCLCLSLSDLALQQ